MRLSRKGEYACLAMIDLAQQYGKGLTSTAAISKRKGIPPKYLEQILAALKQAGYVRSRVGAGGGHRLAKDPSRISVAQVLRLIDGPLAPVTSVSRYFYESTPIEKSPKMKRLLQDIRDYIAARLEKTTFHDLI